MRILLVEDNPGDVRPVRLALKTAGVECDLQVIPDGAEALQFLRQLEAAPASAAAQCRTWRFSTSTYRKTTVSRSSPRFASPNGFPNCQC